jgi:predicted DNA-binding protein
MVNRIHVEKRARPVRLDRSEADHKRLERLAGERGRNKASYVRMAVLERMKADETQER